MVQLLFGLGVDNSTPWWGMDVIRSILSVFDMIVYSLLSFIYAILFNIADSPIISSVTIKVFYERVQLIIGVFMIFKLAISVLEYVINPDAFSDQKKGMGKIITRLITMLLMFTVIRPLNIPNAAAGSYNAYLNQHGLLFGTLYSLQSRVLKQGVIQELVLGYATPSDQETTAASGDNDDSGNAMSNFLLRVFVRVNVNDINKPVKGDNFKVDEGALEDDYKNAYLIYADKNASAIDLLMNINATDGKHYAFAYFPIVSTICGAIIFVIMCAFCIDVATRSLKLAILRLIAPIPIISYIDPKSSEKGSFATWTKMLVSTFLNLFIILAVVHFAVFLVEQIIIPNGDGSGFAISFSDNVMVNLLTIVFIIIGIFYFAKQAPKFIMDALGIKGMGLGAGLSGLFGAAGALMGGGGLSGAAAGFMNASTQAADAAAQGKQAPEPYSSQRDRIAKLTTGNKDAVGGLLGNLTTAANERNAADIAWDRFGINRNVVGDAKTLKYDFAGAATAAKNRYDRYAQGRMTQAEQNSFLASDDFYNNFGSTDAFSQYLNSIGMREEAFAQLSEDQKKARMDTAYNALDADAQKYAMTQMLEHDVSTKETISAKQNAWFEEGADILKGMGINETFHEKYSANGRNRAHRVYDLNSPANTNDNRRYGINHMDRRS